MQSSLGVAQCPTASAFDRGRAFSGAGCAVFALPNEPLAIFKAVSAFALRGLNISKIESRPSAALGDRFTTAYHWE
jgi:prephenate dehydratase